ncbi:MAG: proteasome beta subunit [Actinomycetota bacterium]|jgi:proteasome beta subunit|nr:proteasome beta subunit [Actinomycetota bacterium]
MREEAFADLIRVPIHGPGASFSEVLKSQAQHLLPSPDPKAHLEVPEGTTVLALRYAEGVIMAGDRRATEGFQIAHRSIEKVFAADRMSAIAIAGAAGPAVEIVRLFQTELEHYEKVEGERLTLEGKANKLSQMIRANLPAAMQGLVVVPLFAGYDEARQLGRIFKYDVTGGRYEEDDYHATGSGGKDARSSLKKRYRPDLTREDAVKAAIEALFDAADEDVGTGGPDLIRGIFPNVAVISMEGIKELAEDEIRTLFDELISERRQEMLQPETHPVDVRRPGDED